MEVGRRGNGSRSTLSQINVTPFVDVMLVLLIIFMVTAPMMDKGIDVNLPEVKNAPNLEAMKEPLIVSVARNGSISIGHSRVSAPEKMVPVLQQILRERKEKEVFLQADRDVPYGKVVEVMAAIREAGIQKLGMVARPPES
jgi:biopolymer transport protein TolR